MSRRRVEIVGGGLAGLCVGTELVRAGIPTTIFEAGDYPRHRVCGEFVAGLSGVEATKLRPLFKDAIAHRDVAWFCGERMVRRQTLTAPAWGISRITLDKRMADHFVEAGGDLRTRTRIADNACPPGRVLAVGRPAHASEWVGLKLHLRGIELEADLEVHLGRGSYVGLCKVDDGWINLCGLFSRQTVSRGAGEDLFRRTLLASGLVSLAKRVEHAEIRRGSAMATAGLAYARQVDGTTLQLGDAFAMIPPFTGNGMALAFQSAMAAFAPIKAWSEGASSWTRAVHEAKRAIAVNARRRLRIARMLHPWLLRPMRQRVFSFAQYTRVVPLGTLTHFLHR